LNKEEIMALFILGGKEVLKVTYNERCNKGTTNNNNNGQYSGTSLWKKPMLTTKHP
jgi:hypothetical protein